MHKYNHQDKRKNEVEQHFSHASEIEQGMNESVYELSEETDEENELSSTIRRNQERHKEK